MSEQIIEHAFQIPGSDYQLIRGDLRLAVGRRSKGIVIFCHGLKGFKDWGGWPHLMRALAKSDFVTIAFNMSHGGIGETLDQFTELELFRNNTYSREREDLEKVINATCAGALPGLTGSNGLPIFLLGHSRGGACVLCLAGSRSEVKAVATLASISSLGRVPPRLEQKWRSEGVHYVENARTKQRLPMGVGLLDEILAGENIIEHAVRSLGKPLLVIHGTADDAVNCDAAYQLASWAPGAELMIVEGADHTFGMKHPFSAEMIAQGSFLDRMLVKLEDFFTTFTEPSGSAGDRGS